MTATRRVMGEDVKVGDAIAFLGDPIVVQRFESAVTQIGPARIAIDARNRGITVFDGHTVTLVDVGGDGIWRRVARERDHPPTNPDNVQHYPPTERITRCPGPAHPDPSSAYA